jgi:hypothetical protein
MSWSLSQVKYRTLRLIGIESILLKGVCTFLLQSLVPSAPLSSEGTNLVDLSPRPIVSSAQRETSGGRRCRRPCDLTWMRRGCFSLFWTTHDVNCWMDEFVLFRIGRLLNLYTPLLSVSVRCEVCVCRWLPFSLSGLLRNVIVDRHDVKVHCVCSL